MTRRRWIIAGSGVLATLLLSVGAAVWWLATTESGLRFLVDRALAGSGGVLAVGSVGGSLSETAELRRLSYSDTSVEVFIEQLEVRLGLAALLVGRLDIEELNTSPIEVRLLETEGTAAPAAVAGEPFRLPLPIGLRRASFGGIVVETSGSEPVVVDRILLAGFAVGTSARIERLETNWQGFFLSSQGSLDWGRGFDIDGLLSWSGELRDQNWLGSVRLSGQWPRLEIEQELLEPISQSASGQVVLADNPEFDLDIALADIGGLGASGGFDPALPGWHIEISGAEVEPQTVWPELPGIWRLNGRAQVMTEPALQVAVADVVLDADIGGQQVAVALAGVYRQDAAELSIELFDARLGDNSLSLSGAAGASLGLRLDAELGNAAQIADLLAEFDLPMLTQVEPLLTGIEGRVEAGLLVTGSPSEPLADGRIQVSDGAITGLPFSALGELAIRIPLAPGDAQTAAGVPAIAIRQFEAGLGSNSVVLSGSVGDIAASGVLPDPALGLEFTVRIPEPAELGLLLALPEVRALTGIEAELADLNGLVTTSGSLAGTLARPELNAELAVEQLDAGLPWPVDGELSLELGVFQGGRANFELDATSDVFTLSVDSAGAIDGTAWRGSLRTLRFGEPLLGIWSLDGPTELFVGTDRLQMAPACFANGDSALCAEVNLGGQSDRLLINADQFELATLNPLLPPTVRLAGAIALDVSLDSPTGQAAGTLSAGGNDIEVEIAMSETDRVTTEFESVSVEAELEDYALRLDAELIRQPIGQATISMTTTDIRDPSAEIGGRFDILWPDLAVVSLLSPEIGEVGGTVSVAIDVAGTAEAPFLSGSAELRQGRVAVPEWGLLIEDIEADALSPDGRELQFGGRGLIEDREIVADGLMELDPAAGWPTRITLNGENVPIARRADAVIFASPELEANILLPRIEVGGQVVIPEADISVDRLPEQAVRISPDSVIHGEAASESVRPLLVTADVTVVLGDAVRYTGSNLRTELDGELRLQYQSGLSPVASGSVRLNGSYDAYGQNLALERGELLFAGPLDNPAMDVRAIREIGTTTVGINLLGTLQEPIVTVYSDPAMSEANALSYLISGRPISTTGDAETATLASTALALGLQQALPAVQSYGESIGLDELTIETTDVDAGSLMAGKYLSPRLYLSYTYGLFNRLGGFLVRYDINDQFQLETRSGNETSMDLLYTVEKD